MRRHDLLPALALLALLPVIALGQEGEVPEALVEVAGGNVHMISTGLGVGNVGASVGADGVLIVDDQMAPLTEAIREALAGLADGNPAFVLNTHWHPDHTGGNLVFAEDATIIAHANVWRRLSVRQEILDMVFEPSPAEALPVITFADSVSIYFNGEEIRAIHTPNGHTDGDIVIWFTGSNVVHMGDLYFRDVFPFIDLTSGGSVGGTIQAVEAVLESVPGNAAIIPGHGPLATVDDLRRYHAMLVETWGVVRNGVVEGRSLEEIQAAGMPGYESWAWEFVATDTWIETLYTDATAGDGEYREHGHGDGGDDDHGHADDGQGYDED